MTSLPPAAVPGPDGVPSWEEDDAHQQPDPFGDATDDDGGDPDSDDKEHRDDPRAQ